MPRLNQIFKGISFKDLKRGQCSHIKPIEQLPFIRRCSSPVAEGLTVCLRHAFSVTFRVGDGRHTKTKHFDTYWAAEDFRKRSVANSWVDTNYRRHSDDA